MAEERGHGGSGIRLLQREEIELINERIAESAVEGGRNVVCGEWPLIDRKGHFSGLAGPHPSDQALHGGFALQP
jgi:hypothetical protein